MLKSRVPVSPVQSFEDKVFNRPAGNVLLPFLLFSKVIQTVIIIVSFFDLDWTNLDFVVSCYA